MKCPYLNITLSVASDHTLACCHRFTRICHFKLTSKYNAFNYATDTAIDPLVADLEPPIVSYLPYSYCHSI